MSDAEWRSALEPGWLLDVFDGKSWRESKVLSTAAAPAADEAASSSYSSDSSGSDPQVLVVTFRELDGHRLQTTRGAGAGADNKPAAGHIAKPYTKVRVRNNCGRTAASSAEEGREGGREGDDEEAVYGRRRTSTREGFHGG
jgi:hypothetical protein